VDEEAGDTTCSDGRIRPRSDYRDITTPMLPRWAVWVWLVLMCRRVKDTSVTIGNVEGRKTMRMTIE
jgi:hypothetical protein